LVTNLPSGLGNRKCKPTADGARTELQARKHGSERTIMERITTILDGPTENRKTRTGDALPMREILDELFDWCRARFPELTITAMETQGSA
jgi:hypothetical protein